MRRSSTNTLLIILIILAIVLIAVHLHWIWTSSHASNFRLIPPNPRQISDRLQVRQTPKIPSSKPKTIEKSSKPKPKGATPLLSLNLNDQSWKMDSMRDQFFKEVMRTHFRCNRVVRVGRQGDGGWDVCMDDGLTLKKGGCLVYSFGVGNIWEFDEQLSGSYNCTVRAFDPTMGKPKHVHTPGHVNFYPIGIGGKPNDTKGRFPTQNLLSFLKTFGESGRTLDLVKIDVEYSEWESLTSMIKNGMLKKVKQLLMEYHTREVTGHMSSFEDYKNYLKIMQTLEESGFRKFKATMNNFGIGPYRGALQRRGIYTKKLMSKSCCYEVYYVNMNFRV